jgi:hypothetical protein
LALAQLLSNNLTFERTSPFCLGCEGGYMADDKERQEIKSRILQQIDSEIDEAGGSETTRHYNKGGAGYGKKGSGGAFIKTGYEKHTGYMKGGKGFVKGG